MNDTHPLGDPRRAPHSVQSDVTHVMSRLDDDEREEILAYIAAGGFTDLVTLCEQVMSSNISRQSDRTMNELDPYQNS